MPSDVFKEIPPQPRTALDMMTASAKKIVDDETRQRLEKTARLKAARMFRDANDANQAIGG